MKFRLEIELGNEGSITYEEIGTAIEQSLNLYHNAVALGSLPILEDEGTIRDNAGDAIGEWEVTE